MLVSQDVRRDFANRRLEKPLRRLRVRQQRLHLPSQRFVVSARRRHERGPLARIAVERGVAHVLDPPPALGVRHRRFSFELAKQPEFRQPPVAFDGVGRDVEHLGRLLHAQAAEEAQFDRPGSSERRPPPMPPGRDPARPRPLPAPAT